MKTLVVCFSKTGNTKKVAEAIISRFDCDFDEILYDEKAKSVKSGVNPENYGKVILLCPIWAFSLPEPMKLYLKKYGSKIKNYSLVVTYGLMGLRGCVRNCKSIIGKPPSAALKIKDKDIKSGAFDIKTIESSI